MRGCCCDTRQAESRAPTGLPLVFPSICPNPHALPKSINTDISGLHPLLEGRGLAASFGVSHLPSPSFDEGLGLFNAQSLFKLRCHVIEFLTFEFRRRSFISPTMTTLSPPLLLSFSLVVSRIPGGPGS